MRMLTAEEAMLIFLKQEGWAWSINIPHWHLIKAPSWPAAQCLVKNFRDVLEIWGQRAPVYFQYAKNYLMQLEGGELVNIAIAGIPANRELLDTFGLILNSPSRSFSLVHVPTQRQFVVNAGAGGRFMLNVDPKEASRWRRQQYWMPNFLDQFNQAWRRDMQPGSDRWYEYRYRIDSRAPVEDRPVASADYELVTRYRLILGPNDEPFHLGENLAMEPISA